MQFKLILEQTEEEIYFLKNINLITPTIFEWNHI